MSQADQKDRHSSIEYDDDDPLITSASSSVQQPATTTSQSSNLSQRCCRIKPLHTIKAEQKAESTSGTALKRELDMTDLVAYGLGSTLGAGLFVVAGQAASGSGSRSPAGPAVSLSFLFAAIACLFSALCYAEFASRIPVAGSAYSFAYASLGEGVAWFIGWNLTLEYGVSAAAVARAWEQYVIEFFRLIDFPLPTLLYALPLPFSSASTSASASPSINNTTINATVSDMNNINTSDFTISLLAPLIIVWCSLVLLKGAKTSARFNFVVMCFNLCLVLFIVLVGSTKVETTNWKPFAPFGIRGIIDNSGFVFFSYIGFDCVCTLAEELKHPQRDLPRGIVLTLVIVTTLYILVSMVLTGMLQYTMISSKAPLADAFTYVHLPWATFIVALGTTTTLTATTLCSLYGQPRIFFRMARDGLLFEKFGKVNTNGVPTFGVWITCLGASLLSALFDLGSLAEMISIGTLLAFSCICLGVLVLRYGKEDMNSITEGTGDIDIDVQRNNMLGYVCLITFVIAQTGCNVGLLYGNDSMVSTLGIVVMGLISIISVIVLWLGQTQLKYEAKFKCPWVPLIPCLGVFVNTNLILALPSSALIRLVVWTVLGFGVWFGYGARHSKLEYT